MECMSIKFNILSFCFCFFNVGKQRYLRLIPVGALDGQDVEWTKVPDTKGCITFCTMCIHKGNSSIYLFCSAIKKQVNYAYFSKQDMIKYVSS